MVELGHVFHLAHHLLAQRRLKAAIRELNLHVPGMQRSIVKTAIRELNLHMPVTQRSKVKTAIRELNLHVPVTRERKVNTSHLMRMAYEIPEKSTYDGKSFDVELQKCASNDDPTRTC